MNERIKVGGIIKFVLEDSFVVEELFCVPSGLVERAIFVESEIHTCASTRVAHLTHDTINYKLLITLGAGHGVRRERREKKGKRLVFVFAMFCVFLGVWNDFKKYVSD